ncbi:MAG: SCP2 sterol-binding domain-containing protein [Pseudomonadota bacterium]
MPSPSPLASLAAQVLEAAFSAALAAGEALTPEARAELDALAGKRVLLDVERPAARLLLVFEADTVRVFANLAASEPPDTILRGALADLGAALLGRAGDVTIEGDERTLLTLQNALRAAGPELLRPLERFGRQPLISDLLGHAELALGALQGAASDTAAAAGRQFAGANDLDQFARRLEDLQLDVDRLHARLDRLTRPPASAGS